MVQAYDEDRKTFTRRPIKPQPEGVENYTAEYINQAWQTGFVGIECKYGKVGDIFCVNGDPERQAKITDIRVERVQDIDNPHDEILKEALSISR